MVLAGLTRIAAAASLLSVTVSTAAVSGTFSCLTPERNATSRIVGGQDVSHDQYPWQVSISRRGSDPLGGHFCGGVLIGAEWVATAAHCVKQFAGKPGDLQVVHGVTDLSKERGTRRGVAKIFVHERYGQVRGSDIALLKLSKPITGAKRSYALLPKSDIAERFVFSEACAVVTGWGVQRPGGAIPEQLNAVSIPLVDNETCEAAYRQHYGSNYYIPDTDLCAGFPQGGKDSCQGDSGGPLVVEGGPRGYVLAGIVSRGGYKTEAGFYCALEEGYGIYTRVSSFLSWMLNIIKNN